MSRLVYMAVAALTVAGLSAPISVANAATTAAKPAAKPAPTVVANLFCQLNKSGDKVSVQAVNKGMTVIKAGTVFDFTVIGPRHRTAEAYKLQWDIGPHEALNVTKPMPASDVTGCKPTAA